MTERVNNAEKIRAQLGAGFSPYYHDLDLLLKLRHAGLQGSVIYDIGASNTIWSVMAQAVFPAARLEMFEPLADISDRYLNGKLTHPTVRAFLNTADYQIHPVALGSKNGTCRFHRMEDEAASTSLWGKKTARNAEVIPVPIHRLDDLIRKKNLRPPEIMKLDTQGSELDILLGARKALASVRAVLIECWLTKGYGNHTPLFFQMASFLAREGFVLADLGAEYRSPQHVLHTRDALFLKPGSSTSSGMKRMSGYEPTPARDAFSVMKTQGLELRQIIVFAQAEQPWKAMAARDFPQARWNPLPISGSPASLSQKPEDGPMGFIFAAASDSLEIPLSALLLLNSRTAVVVRCPMMPKAEVSNSTYLRVARLLAAHDFHFFDFVECMHDPETGFLTFLDIIFLPRINQKSPLRYSKVRHLYGVRWTMDLLLRAALSRLRSWRMSFASRASVHLTSLIIMFSICTTLLSDASGSRWVSLAGTSEPARHACCWPGSSIFSGGI